jgi:hypothetical protein
MEEFESVSEEIKAEAESPTVNPARWFKCISGPIQLSSSLVEIGQVVSLPPLEAAYFVGAGCLIEALESEVPKTEE